MEFYDGEKCNALIIKQGLNYRLPIKHQPKRSNYEIIDSVSKGFLFNNKDVS